MPAWPARSAISAPTCFDLADLSPDEPRTDASRVDADTSVLPVTSSISCANMCLAERVTTRRGRTALPLTFFLTLRWRREREAERALARPVIRPCARVLLPDMSYFPAFPTLRRICSPWYRTPLPLYGSGLRSLRMLAATSPTCCLSIPSTTNLVGVSTRNEIPSGALTGSGWL